MLTRFVPALLIVLVGWGTFSSAQEMGISAGAQESNASGRNPGDSTSGDFGIRAGFIGSFLLEDNLKFRTGLMYTQRHFDYKTSGGDTYTFNWDYVDVPALIQYNFNEIFGLFGGVIIAINSSHAVSGTPTYTVTGEKDLTPIFQAGVNLLFDNMYGFDLFYEQGFDTIDSNTKDLGAFGASFIYYFY
jgi:hypothetical protein